MVFVVDVEAVEDGAAEGTHGLVVAAAGAEEIPQLGRKGGGLGVAREGGGGFGAAEAEEDLLAEGLARLDVGFEGGAAEEAGRACGAHLGGGAGAGGAEVEGGIAAGAEEGGQEGEDDDVDVWVLAHLGERGLACCGGLAVVDGEIGGGLGVEYGGVLGLGIRRGDRRFGGGFSDGWSRG